LTPNNQVSIHRCFRGIFLLLLPLGAWRKKRVSLTF